MALAMADQTHALGREYDRQGNPGPDIRTPVGESPVPAKAGVPRQGAKCCPLLRRARCSGPRTNTPWNESEILLRARRD